MKILDGWEVELREDWTTGNCNMDTFLIEMSETHPDVEFLICKSKQDFSEEVSCIFILHHSDLFEEYIVDEWEEYINELAENLGYMDYIDIIDDKDGISNSVYSWLVEDIPILMAGCFYTITNRSELAKRYEQAE